MKTKILLLFIFTIIFYFKFSFSQTLPWQEIASITNVNLNCITYGRSYYYPAWACGDNGTVIRTTGSSPLNWTNVSGNGLPSNINLVTIGSNNMNVALTAGNIGTNTYMYRTSNNGLNWTLVFTQNGGSIKSISFGLNNDYTNKVVMIGNPVGGRWSIWKSIDAGITWDSTGIGLAQSGSELNLNNSIWTDLTSNSIWFGTNNSRIYYSSNAGTSWNTQTVTETNIYSLWFNAGTGTAAGTNLLKTTNYGVNWSPQTVPGTGSFTGTGGTPVSTNIEAFTRGSNTIYYANGTNWLTYTAPSGNYTYINSIRVLSFWVPQYAIRDNGGMSFRYYWPEAISKISDEIPNSFSLRNNYPNPFNPSTVIEYQIPVNSNVKLNVYDISGKLIETLVNQTQSPGIYRAGFDGSLLSSGIYFYRLETDIYSVTKKMIVLK